MNYKYDPENWLLSTIRCIEEYTVQELSYRLDLDATDLYEVVMEYPGPLFADRSRLLPFDKTLIHFEADAIDERVLGLGRNEIEQNYDPATETVNPQEAGVVLMNFDVGIWTSDRTGGATARAETRTLLSQIFQGHQALEKFRAETNGGDGGIEIVRYSGGRFATDKVNDVPVFRTLDGMLELKVFSRTPLSASATPTIEEIGQTPGLTILG